MIKALLFDLGNVLVGFDQALGYRAIAPYCPYAEEQIPLVIRGTGLVPRFERGELANEEFFRLLSEALRLELSYEQFCELWSSIFLPEPLVPQELVEGLRRRYRMVLISNTNGIHFQILRRNYPLLEHFDAHVLSHEVGALKPAEAMYREAVQQAACEPQECLYIDDVVEFVEGGRRYGLQAIQFRGAAPLEEELRRRGIEWG